MLVQLPILVKTEIQFVSINPNKKTIADKNANPADLFVFLHTKLLKFDNELKKKQMRYNGPFKSDKYFIWVMFYEIPGEIAFLKNCYSDDPNQSKQIYSKKPVLIILQQDEILGLDKFCFLNKEEYLTFLSLAHKPITEKEITNIKNSIKEYEEEAYDYEE